MYVLHIRNTSRETLFFYIITLVTLVDSETIYIYSIYTTSTLELGGFSSLIISSYI